MTARRCWSHRREVMEQWAAFLSGLRCRQRRADQAGRGVIKDPITTGALSKVSADGW